MDAARREFAEEIGSPCPDGEALELGEIRQKSGKRVLAWAVEGDLDADAITSTRSRSSGRPAAAAARSSPRWTAPPGSRSRAARTKILAAQAEFLARLRGLSPESR